MSSPKAALLIAALLASASFSSCGTTGGTRAATPAAAPKGVRAVPEAPAPASINPDLPISRPPFDRVKASWKDRMEVPYAYLEHRGTYAETGALIPALLRELAAQGLEPDGAPFALFYDDPGRTPAGQLRSRACVPVRGRPRILAPLRFEVLPSRTVAYAFASGAYPEVPRAYPGLLRYAEGMNWQPAGPIRETYLVAPGPGVRMEELLTEIQVPVRGRE
jgi:effector-binding domain-containing protein